MMNLVKNVSNDTSFVLCNILFREKERAVAQGENTIYAGFFRLIQAAQTHFYTFDKVIPLISHYSIRYYSKAFFFSSTALTMGLIGTSMFLSGVIPIWVERKINDHAGTFFQVAMIVQALFITCFGSPLSGGIALTFLAYEVLTKNLSLIPSRFRGSWVEETAISSLRIFCSMLSQRLYLIGIGIIDLMIFLRLFNKISCLILLKCDALFCSLANLFYRKLKGEGFFNYLSLNQLALPGRESPFSYRQILEIMETKDKNLTLSSAHFDKGMSLPPLPIDKNFEKFHEIFAAVLTPENRRLLYPKCKCDVRFRSFLLQLAPEEDRCLNEFKTTFFSLDKNRSSSAEELADKFWERHFQRILKKVADKKGVSESDFILNWCKEQAAGLVDKLCQKKAFLGNSLNGEDVSNNKTSAKIFENCGKILHFLKSRELPKDKMAFEDCTINVAIRVGEYCAEGAYNYTEELVDTYLLPEIRLNQLQNQSDVERFETTIYDNLSLLRKQTIQAVYQEATLSNEGGRAALAEILGNQKKIDSLIKRMAWRAFAFIVQRCIQARDIHTYNFIAGTLSMAFRPLNTGDFERFLGFMEFRGFGTIDRLYTIYQEKIFSFFNSPQGREGLFSYVYEKVVRDNPLLSENEKDKIVEKLSTGQSSRTIFKRFLNLALVQLKIMK